jgi:hypothetical protein
VRDKYTQQGKKEIPFGHEHFVANSSSSDSDDDGQFYLFLFFCSSDFQSPLLSQTARRRITKKQKKPWAFFLVVGFSCAT